MTREEAIKILREAHDNALFSVRTALETLIPELKESEDEKIRRELIDFIQWSVDRHFMREDFYQAKRPSEWIDYLKKQKEVGIRWFESDNIKNPEKPYIDKVGMFYTTDGRMCHASDIEKQKDILSERATNITANMLEDGIEGIQRELIEFLSNTINAPWIDVIKSADAYAQRIKSMIEKQKDKFASETMAMKDKIDEGFTKFMEKEHKKENLRDFIDNFPYSDKQKEQKSDSLIYDKDLDKAAREFYLSGGAASPVDSTGLVPIVRMAEFGATWMKERMEKEQKPSHKFNVGDTIHCKYDDREFTIKSVDLANGVYKYTKEGCGNDIDYADENFELVEHKPAEWSEEDEKILNEIITIMEGGKVTSGTYLSEYAYWLKSLRPSWKPSEEQMKALKNSAYGTYQNGDGPVLRGLYEQLEKLK